MAITISDRISAAIGYMDNGKYEQALSEVCIAIDVTSKKCYGADVSSKNNYKKFVRENLWIIINATFGGIVSKDVKFPYKTKEGEDYSSVEDIVYHLMRCGFIHGTGEECSNIIWNPRVKMAFDVNGNLQISPSFIWGLILSVVVSPVNGNEHIGDTAWITVSSFKYLINDLWGELASVKNIFKCDYGVEFITDETLEDR